MRDAILFLLKEMERQNCKFGDQIVPTFLKPVFFSEKELPMITHVSRHIINILEKVADLYFSHPEMREYFNLKDKFKRTKRNTRPYLSILVKRAGSG